jgi:hypothetical protein
MEQSILDHSCGRDHRSCLRFPFGDFRNPVPDSFHSDLVDHFRVGADPFFRSFSRRERGQSDVRSLRAASRVILVLLLLLAYAVFLEKLGFLTVSFL